MVLREVFMGLNDCVLCLKHTRIRRALVSEIQTFFLLKQVLMMVMCLYSVANFPLYSINRFIGAVDPQNQQEIIFYTLYHPLYCCLSSYTPFTCINVIHNILYNKITTLYTTLHNIQHTLGLYMGTGRLGQSE